MNTFDGIPAGASGFYADLEQNNNRDWWLEHKARYETLVREPLTALLAELEPRFGPAQDLPAQPGHPVLPGQVTVQDSPGCASRPSRKAWATTCS